LNATEHSNLTDILSTLIIALLSSLWAMTLQAQANYVAFELESKNNWEQQLVLKDLNGDGRKDIVHADYQPGIGRELHIFHQQVDGSFANTPQRIEVKTEIIAIAFADLRQQPGLELVLYSNAGVFSLSSVIEGYSGNIKQLVEWELIAAVPSLEHVHFMPDLQDINNDGEVDLLLPGDNIYGFFKGKGNETFELASTFSTSNENMQFGWQRQESTDLNTRISINAEEGVVIELSAGGDSYYDGFIEQWNADKDRKARQPKSLLRTESWMFTAVLARLNADELVDIAYINIGPDGLGQLNIHFQSAETGFAEQANWTGSLNTSGDIRLVDMNNDQQLDLLRLDGEDNDTSAYLFRNENGRFDLDKPNQIMRFSGYDVQLNIIPITKGSSPLLNVSYYTIPVVDAVRNASINRSQLLYDSDNVETGQFFNKQPSSKLDESFSAANVRALSEQMSLHYDIDADGRNDALYITENGTLAAKHIATSLSIEEQAFWEYVSERNVFEFEVLHLNQDPQPDLLLRHGTATTILVASPPAASK